MALGKGRKKTPKQASEHSLQSSFRERKVKLLKTRKSAASETDVQDGDRKKTKDARMEDSTSQEKDVMFANGTSRQRESGKAPSEFGYLSTLKFRLANAHEMRHCTVTATKECNPAMATTYHVASVPTWLIMIFHMAKERLSPVSWSNIRYPRWLKPPHKRECPKDFPTLSMVIQSKIYPISAGEVASQNETTTRAALLVTGNIMLRLRVAVPRTATCRLSTSPTITILTLTGWWIIPMTNARREVAGVMLLD